MLALGPSRSPTSPADVPHTAHRTRAGGHRWAGTGWSHLGGVAAGRLPELAHSDG